MSPLYVEAPGAEGIGNRAQGQEYELSDCADAGALAQGTQAQSVSHFGGADKATASAIARAALLGIECQSVEPDAWLMRHATGAPIGIVRGLPALVAAVSGFEAARDDVADLVRRIGTRNVNAPELVAPDPRVLTLKQRLARAGWTLSEAFANDGQGGYFASRWGMVRGLPDLAAVEAFADRVEASC